MWHRELPVAMWATLQMTAQWGPSIQFAGLQVPIAALWPMAVLLALPVALYLTRGRPPARPSEARRRERRQR